MKSIETIISDMIHTIESIENYHVTSFEVFLDDEKTQDAIMYNVIILGEAAKRIGQEFQEEHPEIPWPSFIGTSNVVVHGYDQVKYRSFGIF